jgi:hypothetical protein
MIKLGDEKNVSRLSGAKKENLIPCENLLYSMRSAPFRRSMRRIRGNFLLSHRRCVWKKNRKKKIISKVKGENEWQKDSIIETEIFMNFIFL